MILFVRCRFVPGAACAGLLCLAILGGVSPSLPTHGCDPDHACATKVVDGFFLPLITENLGVAGLGVTGQAWHPLTETTSTPKPSPLPPSGGPIIIRPPAKPQPADSQPPAPQAPAPQAPEPQPTTPQPPVTQLAPSEPDTISPNAGLWVSQSLVIGPIGDGGEVEMVTEWVPDISQISEDAQTRVAVRDLALLRLGTWFDILEREQFIAFPTAHASPLHSLSQRVEMRLTCGACGPRGDMMHLDGTAMLEMQPMHAGRGAITNINLRAAGGQMANGEMRFALRARQERVYADPDASLHLLINGEATNMPAHLLTWQGGDRHMAGIFMGRPVDDAPDIGAFAGQFSGAACVPECGVEN